MKRRSGLLAGGSLLALAAAQAATPGVDAPPEPAPPRPVSVPPLAEHMLANGLTVVIAPRSALPLVSASLLVRAGPEADPPGRAGLAGMVSTLLGKGATHDGRTLGATEIARRAEALGGTLDTGSGARASSAGMTVTTPKLDAALALIGSVVRRPTLAAEELARARVQSLDGLRVALQNPGAVAGMVSQRAYWGPGAYGAVTTAASLKRLTREDVVAFHRHWYRPDQALLVLAGDVTPEQGLALARRHFGDWKAPKMAPPKPRSAPPAPIEQATVLIDMPGAGQSGVIVMAPFATLAPADRASLRIGQVANALLGGGYSARLNQEVRIKRGLSYGAGSSTEVHAEGGMLAASAQTNHPTAAQVAQLLRGEIERIAATEAPAEELAARQATLVGGFARRLETNAGLASLAAGLWSQGRPLAELDRYVAETLAVTPAQVRDFARKHWKPEALRTVVAGDLAAAGDGLKAVGPGTLRLDAKALDFDRAKLDQIAPDR